MTELQIQYFLLVAEELNISKVAERLFVSQPAVSKQISMLEEEIGVKLFTRKSHGIQITEAGRAFEQLFSEFQLRLQETLNTVRCNAQSLSGRYHLGCLEGWDLSSFYPELRAHLEMKYPEIQFDLSGYSLDQVPYVLKRGEANGVITPKSLLSGYPNISVRYLTKVQGFLMFSENHPLADKPDLKLADFKDYPFYITAPQRMRSASVETLLICKGYGFLPRLEYVPTLSAAYLKMQAGRGVLLTLEWMMSRSIKPFKSLPLQVEREVCIGSIPESQSALSSAIENEIIGFFERRDNTGVNDK